MEPSGRPPSDPRPNRPRSEIEWTGTQASFGRPARFQTAVAVVLALLLMAVPLYLWRRPRSVAPVVGAHGIDADGGPRSDVPGTVVIYDVDSGPSGIMLGDARVIECRDPGSKRTPPERCDHLPSIEKSLTDAIQQSRDCVPPDLDRGVIAYVADVSFSRKRDPVQVTIPRDGRSIKNIKTIQGCASAVRRTMSALSLEGLPHEHARYKISVSATYASAR